MEVTATKFRQKVCLKCKGNHDNEGPLCGFCIDKEKQRRAKQVVYPGNYLVECLIERDGDTEVIVAGMRYLFKRNAAGHSVCDVVNYGHYAAFVGKMGKQYRPYQPDVDYPPQKAIEPEPDDSDWPLGVAIKEPDHDCAGTDNDPIDQEAGRDSTGNDRPGSGKRGGAGNRSGAGQAAV